MKQVRLPTVTAARIVLGSSAAVVLTVGLVVLIQFFMGWRATPVDTASEPVEDLILRTG